MIILIKISLYCLFVKLLLLIRYIEDITWPQGDMKFLFEGCKIFHK